jgi:hypothetical protein
MLRLILTLLLTLVSLLPAQQPAPQASLSGQPRQDPQSQTVYITRTGKKYHRAGCGYLRRSSIPVKLKDAKANGYTPCAVCNPPR